MGIGVGGRMAIVLLATSADGGLGIDAKAVAEVGMGGTASVPPLVGLDEEL